MTRISFVLALLWTAPLQAAIITVNDLGDAYSTDGLCSCREAIDNANDNAATWPDCAAGSGIDTISLPSGTITLAGGSASLLITETLVLQGAGVGLTRIDGAGGSRPDRPLTVNSGSPVSLTLQDLTVQNGLGGGGGLLYFNSASGGQLQATNVDFFLGVANNGGLGGGAIYKSGGSNLLISNARFVSNTATGSGGAIHVAGVGTFSLAYSLFEANTAAGGGAIVFAHPSGTILLERSLFNANEADYGGAIFSYGPGVTLVNNSFAGNIANVNEGGALRLDTGATGTVVDHCTFSGNSAVGGQGAIHAVNGSDGTVRRSILWGNGTASVAATGGASLSSLGENVIENGLSPIASDSAGDPLLSALADNGGFTRTLAISSAGSAFNKVTVTTGAVAVDQRGIARPQGLYSDAGAYEWVDPATPSATVSPTPSATPSATATATPSPTHSPSWTATQTISPSPSATWTSTWTAMPSETASPSSSPTETTLNTATATAAPSATVTPNATDTPTATATPTPSATALESATASPTASPTRTITATYTPCGVGVLAGDGTPGSTGNGGPAALARLSGPKAAAFDASGALYIGDTNNTVLRMVDPLGIMNAVSVSASVGYPEDVLVDGAGVVYIADVNTHRVWRRATDGTLTAVAGTGFSGNIGLTFTALATTIPLNQPSGLALDSAGNLYIADQFNHAVRKVDAQGMMSTIVGTGISGYVGEGSATTVRLWLPKKVAVALNGTLYIAENNRIRTVSNGVTATLDTPSIIQCLALDGGQNLFVGLGGGSPVIRRYAFGSAVGVTVSTLGNAPDSINVGPQGTLAIAQSSANRVRGAVSCGIGVVPRAALPVCALSSLQALQSARGVGKGGSIPQGGAILGPNPARAGQAICASLPGAALSATIELYDLHGRLLAARSTQGAAEACLQAPASIGIYFARIEARMMDGTKISQVRKLGVKP